MDRALIDQKLESLRRCVHRVETKRPAEAADLASDLDLQDVISLNLTRAVQLSVDIGAHIIAASEVPPPGTMGETFDLLAKQGVIADDLASRLKKAVGFRNIAVHNYEAINWEIVHSIATDHLSEFAAFARAVVSWLEDSENGPTP